MFCTEIIAIRELDVLRSIYLKRFGLGTRLMDKWQVRTFIENYEN